MSFTDLEWAEIRYHLPQMKDLLEMCESALEQKSSKEIEDVLQCLQSNLKKMPSLNNSNGEFVVASPHKVIVNIQNLHFGNSPGDG